MPIYKHLPHLSRVWSSDPVYFLTTCTHERKPILTNEQVSKILVEEWIRAFDRHGWIIGRYVIMPDHVHFFCSSFTDANESNAKNLSGFMQQWKQWTSKRIVREIQDGNIDLRHPIWQKEFFDHLLRSEEYYRQKWDYVVQNPVRKGLVKKSEDWMWQGEIFDLT